MIPSFKPLYFLSTAAFLAVSCIDYTPYEGSKADLEYAKNFKKQFGDVDPDQDWSMAALVTANLNVGSNATVYVYTDKPGHNGAMLAGIVKGSSAQFNLVKGSKQVYVIVEQGDDIIVSGYFNIVNDIINIDNSPVEKLSFKTRSASGSFTVGTKLFTHTAYAKDADWDGKTYMADATNKLNLFYISREGSEWYLYYAPTPNETFRKLAHNSSDAGNICGYHNNGSNAYYEDDGSLALENFYWPNLIEVNGDGELVFKPEIAKYETRQNWKANYYLITGNTQTDDVTWTLGDCYNLFWGGDAVFHEGEHYNTTTHKLEAYAKYNTSVEELEKGVVFTTSKDDAKIDIPMMFGATVNDNIFGYYYYEEDQDPRTVNRYVLYEDAQPSVNIKVDGTAVGDMDLAGIKGTWKKESVATCTNRSLIYFGKDGNSAGTVNFPKNVKIGFFIMKQHKTDGAFDYAAFDNTSGASETGWAYSDPELNQKYVYNSTGTAALSTWKKREQDSFDKGNVKAITWMYDGRILCGFGDDSGDLDLNDFVWWVDGDVKEMPKIRITSQSSSSWIVACEDLGGTYDYDFNDLVFALRKTQIRDDNTKATLELVPLAAGGTLNAKVVYDGEEKGEIHDLVKTGAPSDTPLNVTSGSKPAAGTPVLLESMVEWNSDINTIIKDKIKVKVIQKQDQNAVESSYYIDAYKKHENAVPQMMILPSGWDWPAEEVPVDKVYAGFKDWAADAKVVTWCYNKNGERASECVTDPLPDVEITTEYFEEPGNGDDVVDGDIKYEAWPLSTDMAAVVYVGTEVSYTTYIDESKETTANNLYVTYASGDESVVAITMTQNGTFKLTPKKVGSTTITITYDNPYDFPHVSTTKDFPIEVRMPDLPYAQFSVPEVLNVVVGASVSFDLTYVESGIDKGKFSYEIGNSNIVTMTNWGGAYSATTIKGVASGQTTIIVKHEFVPGLCLETTKTITVKVGTLVDGNPINITNKVGAFESVQKGWINEKAALVDMSDFDWTGMAGAKLRITGTSSGQVSVSVFEGNNFPINRSTFSNGVIEGTISPLVGDDKFYIVSHANDLTVTKLEIIPMTIQ